MRKFGFLLAIVAVFAMSASAFAADGDISALADADLQGNIGALGKTGTIREATAYYLDGYAGSLDIALKVTLSGTDDVWVGASTDLVGVTLESDQLAVAPFNTADDVTFTIGGWAEMPEKFHLNKIMSWGTGADPVEPTGSTSVSGDVTITTKAVAICLSADGEAVDTIDGYVDIAASEVLSLDITKDTIAPDWANLKVGLISSDLKTVLSQDLTNEIDGLAIAVDSAEKNITIKGTPTAKAIGGYQLGIYTAEESDIMTTDGAVVAGIDADENSLLVLTIFDLVIDKTAAQKVNEAIASASDAVKAELAKVNDGKGGPVALIMDDSGASITSVDVQAVECDYTTTGTLTLTVVSLDLKGATSVDNTVAWTNLEALSADVKSTDHVAYIPAELVDEESMVLTYTIDPVIFKKDSPIPVTTSTIRGAAPAGFHDVEVDYTITFPKAVGVKPLSVTYTTYAKDATSSSSGACSMGAGLVALAGLALVLRKKD